MLKHGISAVVLGAAVTWMVLPRAAYPHNPTTTTVLFNREISALLQRKCVQCHAPGKLAMPLVTYDQTRPWAQAIKEETLARRMPPWPAERGYGTFSNDIGLTPREFEFLISWIDGGVPIGTGDAPPFVDHNAHWTAGTPDVLVTSSTATSVAAHSAPAFKRIVLETQLPRATLIRGFDFKPDPRVTRAAFLSIAGTDQYLGGWTPWQSSTELPSGVAFSLPARARIAVDLLYSGANEAVADTPQLALYRATAAAGSLVSTSVLKPGASSAHASPRLVAEMRFATARSLVSMRPDLGPGARSLEVKLLRADGSTDVLLWMKDIPPNWQTPYVFKKPISVPAGSTLQTIVYGAPFTLAVNHYADQ